MKKIGFIGYGLRSETMMKAFAGIGAEIEAAAIADPRAGEIREKVAADSRFAHTRYYADAAEMLAAACSLLAPGGRLCVITYHSLEDRMVKNMMRAGNVEGRVSRDFFGRSSAPLRQISSTVIVPSAEEQERNPRSRSAKLRIAEKLPDGGAAE